MKRRQRRLEGQPHRQQAKTGESKQARVRLRKGRPFLGDEYEIGRSGGAINKGDPQEQKTGGEGPDQKIFEGRLDRRAPRSVKTGQDIDRDRHHFEPDKNQNQVGTGRHAPHPENGKKNQGIIFGPLDRELFPITIRDQQGEQAGQQKQKGEPIAQTIEQKHPGHHPIRTQPALPNPDKGKQNSQKGDPERSLMDPFFQKRAGQQNHTSRDKRDHPWGRAVPKVGPVKNHSFSPTTTLRCTSFKNTSVAVFIFSSHGLG